MPRITERNFLFSPISVHLLTMGKMKRELKTMPRDTYSLLPNDAGFLPAAFPGVLATVAVSASDSPFNRFRCGLFLNIACSIIAYDCRCPVFFWY